MSEILERLLLPENLYWAWKKAYRLYSQVEGIFERLDVSAFELELEDNLKGIHKDFRKGRYLLQPMRLLPQPKKPDEDGSARMRQSFRISVRDQVAWIAFVNAIGPELDLKMQPWSYGHRLYRAAWYEDLEDERSSLLCIGPYRHAAGHLYRHFKHSWPRFRRHVVLTARFMGAPASFNPSQLEEGERRAFEEQRRAQEELADDRLPYLDHAYWKDSREPHRTVYHAGFDLSKFYPNLSTELIEHNILKSVRGIEDEPLVVELLRSLLAFTVDTRGLSPDLIAASDPPVNAGPFYGIPTGLMCAGFLSNIAMMHVDRVAAEKAREYKIAHFRFVDDHVALGFNFDRVCDWVKCYEEILRNLNVKSLVNRNKFQPKEVTSTLNAVLDGLERNGTSNDLARRSEYKAALMASTVDPANPAPLMTGTLVQISTIAGIDFDVLTDFEKKECLSELEHLITGNISELEVREDTRIAFAAGRIAALAPKSFAVPIELVSMMRDEAELEGPSSKAEELSVLHDTHEQNIANHTLRYFTVLFRAFKSHPDKVRLFHHVLNFCMSTGFGGHELIRDWLLGEGKELSSTLCRYLGAVAALVVASQCLRAVRIWLDEARLERERTAAWAYLGNIADFEIEGFVDLEEGEICFFEYEAGIVANVASSAAAELLRLSSSESEVRQLADKLDRFGNSFEGEVWGSSSEDWESLTGRRFGVWLHWLESGVRGPWEATPSEMWNLAAEFLDVRYASDRAEMRRYPGLVSERSWRDIVRGRFPLSTDDAGWLLEVIGDSEPRVNSLPTTGKHSRLFNVVRSIKSDASGKEVVSLLDWVTVLGRTAEQAPHDPRAGEWSALEIVRQVADRIQEVGMGTLKDLDHLHPANVTVPVCWLGLDKTSGSERPWTWENWRRFSKESPTRVGIRKRKIKDFRYGTEDLSHGSTTWERRLTAIGLLLFGLLRLNFTQPSPWNIRGQQRARLELVRREMEQLAISSWSLTILESCLYARSRENLLLTRFTGFFQNDVSDIRDDTEWDPPKIPELSELSKLLHIAQETLEKRQIAVLDHAPRQLVPVRISQLTGGFWFPEEAEGERP